MMTGDKLKNYRHLLFTGFIAVMVGVSLLLISSDAYAAERKKSNVKGSNISAFKMRMDALRRKRRAEEAMNGAKRVESLSAVKVSKKVITDTPTRHFNIRQEILRSDSTLVSKPNKTDKKVSDFMYNNKIGNLVHYTQWLQDNIVYKDGGKDDEWLEALDVLERKYGDCEDYAVLTSAVSRVMGFKPRFIALIRKNMAHAICIFKQDGYYVWFDNDTLHKTDARTMTEFGQFMTENYRYYRLVELNTSTFTWNTLYEKA